MERREKMLINPSPMVEDSSTAEVYPQKLFLVHKNIHAKKARKEGSKRL